MKHEFVKTRGLFVTGTDTGIGKTMVTGAIARHLHNRGVKVGVFKPVASGCESRREGLVSKDAEFLAHCANSEFSLDVLSNFRVNSNVANKPTYEELEQRIKEFEIINRILLLT